MPTMGTGISTSYPSQAYRPSADGTGSQIVPPTLTQGKKQNPPIQSKGVQYEASYFSSTHSTIACWGGFKYSPTTSVILSRNLGSRDSLNVSTRWGFRLWACQIELTVDLLTP